MPIVLDGGASEAVFWAAVGGWLLGEGAFAARTTLRDPETRDPTFTALTIALVGGLAAADQRRRSGQCARSTVPRGRAQDDPSLA